jgi:hypothetical protein
MLLLDVGDWSPTDRRSGCLSRSFSGADAGGALLKRRAPAKSTTSPHAPARAAESLQCDQDVRQQCALRPAKSASRHRSLSAKTGQFAPRCAATPPCRMAFRANWRITRLHPQVFCLQFHQASSYTSHVSGHGRWRYGSALERRGLGCPLGILRAAEGGKSGVGEVVFATVDTGQYYRVRHIIPRPRRHNMGRPWFTVLWNSLSLPRAEYATNFKVVHYPTDDLFESRFSPRRPSQFTLGIGGRAL